MHKHSTTLNLVWDAFVSNSRDLLEAAVEYFNFNKQGKYFVFVCSGYLRQIPPVVQDGTPAEVIHATCTSSPLWPSFTMYKLEESMRLIALRETLLPTATHAERAKI